MTKMFKTNVKFAPHLLKLLYPATFFYIQQIITFDMWVKSDHFSLAEDYFMTRQHHRNTEEQLCANAEEFKQLTVMCLHFNI